MRVRLLYPAKLRAFLRNGDARFQFVSRQVLFDGLAIADVRDNYNLPMPSKRTSKTYDEESLYEYAIRALGRKMRTVAELKRLMRNRVGVQEHGELLVEVVIARLKQHCYLNDTAYAESYSHYRQENKKFGRMRVTQDLRTKGVHQDIIDKVVSATYSQVDEEQLAREFLQRRRVVKPTGSREAARVFRMLARAGFSTRVIFRILKMWDVDDETISVLESEPLETEDLKREPR